MDTNLWVVINSSDECLLPHFVRLCRNITDISYTYTLVSYESEICCERYLVQRDNEAKFLQLLA